MDGQKSAVLRPLSRSAPVTLLSHVLDYRSMQAAIEVQCIHGTEEHRADHKERVEPGQRPRRLRRTLTTVAELHWHQHGFAFAIGNFAHRIDGGRSTPLCIQFRALKKNLRVAQAISLL